LPHQIKEVLMRTKGECGGIPRVGSKGDPKPSRRMGRRSKNR